jgi:hypothetical protein
MIDHAVRHEEPVQPKAVPSGFEATCDNHVDTALSDRLAPQLRYEGKEGGAIAGLHAMQFDLLVRWLPTSDNPGRRAEFDGEIGDWTRGDIRRHEKSSAAMIRTVSVCRESACIASGTRFPTACHGHARAEWRRSLRGSFFKGLLGLRITLWMLRSDRKPHIAQGLELLANCAFVQPDPEHLLDPPFEIGASPPNYAVFFRIGTFLDKSGKFGLLRCAQLARAARPLRFLSPAKPSAL